MLIIQTLPDSVSAERKQKKRKKRLEELEASQIRRRFMAQELRGRKKGSKIIKLII